MKNMVIYAAFLFLGEVIMQEFDMNELNKKFLKNGFKDMSLKEMRFFFDNYSKKDSQEKRKDDLGLLECENLSENKIDGTSKNDSFAQEGENEKFSSRLSECENLSENKMEWTSKNDQLTQKSENEKFSFDEKHFLFMEDLCFIFNDLCSSKKEKFTVSAKSVFKAKKHFRYAHLKLKEFKKGRYKFENSTDTFYRKSEQLLSRGLNREYEDFQENFFHLQKTYGDLEKKFGPFLKATFDILSELSEQNFRSFDRIPVRSEIVQKAKIWHLYAQYQLQHLNNQKSIISSQNNRQIQSNFNWRGRTYGD